MTKTKIPLSLKFAFELSDHKGNNKMQKILLVCASFLMILFAIESFALPTGFVYLKDIDASIIQDMRYVTHNNFNCLSLHCCEYIGLGILYVRSA